MQRRSGATVSLTISAVLVLSLALGLLPTEAVAQQETDSLSMEEALSAHRHPVRLGGGSLLGDGGRMLRERAAEATVTVLGEMHGTKNIPRLMSALLSSLQTHGELDVLALETSPWTTERMKDSLQQGVAAYNRLIAKYPAAIPFYNLRSERDLLAQFVERGERNRPLWGLDQIFAFAGPIAFDRLEALAPSARARRSLDTLRARFAGSAEAEALLRELSISARIYRLNDTDNYRSNQLRARYLRQNLRERTETAQTRSEHPAQMAIKVGGFHAFRGRTPNNALDVGNLAVELAERHGGEAFNVAFLCGPGSQNRAFPNRTAECWPERLGSAFRSLTEALPEDADAAFFDSQALRPLVHEGDSSSQRAR